MPHSKIRIIAGEPLLAALRAMTERKKTTPVLWHRADGTHVRIPADQAREIVRAGIYEGQLAGPVRVKAIWDRGPVQQPIPEPEWVHCFRTTEAPVFGPSPLWFDEMGYSRAPL